MKKLIFSTAILFATPVFADLTVDDVQSASERFLDLSGGSFSYEEMIEEGDSRTFRNVMMSQLQPDGDVTSFIEYMTLTPDGEGGIIISVPQSFYQAINFEDDLGREMSFRNVIRTNEPVSVLATGTPDNIILTYSDTGSTIEMQGSFDDEETVNMSMTLGAATTDTELDFTTDPGVVSMAFEVDYITLSGVIPEAVGSGTLDIRIEDISSSAINPIVPTDDIINWVRAGHALEQYLTTGPITASVTSTEDGITERVGVNISNSQFDFISGGYAMEGGVSLGDLRIDIDNPDIQVDGLMTVSEIAGALTYAVPPEETLTPASFELAFTDVTLADEAWAEIDLPDVIPRDPFQLSMNIEGNVEQDTDWENIINTLDFGEASAALRYLNFSGFGIELFGRGEIARVPGSGDYRGTGSVNFSGPFALITALQDAGLLDWEMGLGARVVIGTFARRLEGEDDAWESDILFEGGELYINGLPLSAMENLQ